MKRIVTLRNTSVVHIRFNGSWQHLSLYKRGTLQSISILICEISKQHETNKEEVICPLSADAPVNGFIISRVIVLN